MTGCDDEQTASIAIKAPCADTFAAAVSACPAARARSATIAAASFSSSTRPSSSSAI
jgi:hypothetical protein